MSTDTLDSPAPLNLTPKERRQYYMREYGKIYYAEQKELNTAYYQKSLQLGRERYQKSKEAMAKLNKIQEKIDGIDDTDKPVIKSFKKRNIKIPK
jgi:hypothetical protein